MLNKRKKFGAKMTGAKMAAPNRPFSTVLWKTSLVSVAQLSARSMELKDPQSATVSASLDSPAQSMIPDRNQLDWDEYLASLEALLSRRCILPTNRNYDRRGNIQIFKMAKTQLKIDDSEIFHDGQTLSYFAARIFKRSNSAKMKMSPETRKNKESDNFYAHGTRGRIS
uniref:Uncharacterized protein n=1 Tax=Romanomermis culicivorax TaxID=13658 RepID=A0A915J9C7_ROMCU